MSALLPDTDLEVGPSSGLQILSIRDIIPNRQQPRQDFDSSELSALAASIREKGIIQPLIVRKLDSGYELIAGERRLQAAIQLGVYEVPARIMEISDETEMLELSIIENLQRKDLNAYELATGYRSLQVKWGLTQEKIAQRIGRERATVANTLRLLELPDPVLQSLRRGEITSGHAKAILAAGGAARQSALWKRVVAEGLSVRQTEQIARS